jgi:putative alpha-1,2-mannosidase
MYNYVDRPDKAQKLLRRVMDTLYDDAPAGLCGNEDVGQMSAWYIMSALGFYQVEPSGGRYQLGCPIVRKARINVGGGRTFVVETVGNPSKGRVRKWLLNGKMLNRTYITHDEVMSGGELKALF